MTRRLFAIAVLLAGLSAGALLYAQSFGPKAPLGTVLVKSDSGGNLRVYSSAAQAPYGPLTPLGSVIGKSDSNGSLGVAVLGGNMTPDTICLDATNQDACLTRSATNTIKFATTSAGSTAAPIVFSTGTAGTSVVSPLFQSTAAKVLLQGTGTGATQIAATQTTPPTCTTNCGTSPSVVGTDSAGIVTMGSTGSPASGWVVTFNGTWAAAPSCLVQSALGTMAGGKIPAIVVTTTTTFTVTTSGTAPSTSDKYAFQCVGVQ